VGICEVDRMDMTRDTAKVILLPFKLMLCIPHLMKMDGPFMKMWKEEDLWKECECEDR